jgi:hypothetical protein
MALHVTAGNMNDCTAFADVMGQIRVPRPAGVRFALVRFASVRSVRVRFASVRSALVRSVRVRSAARLGWGRLQ